MNIHLIYAHPTPGSMNSRLKSTSQETLEALGHTVQISDLYAQRFNAVAGPEDFTELLNPEYFDLQKEQVHALERGTFVPEIRIEQDKLRWADAL
ncbi:MAG: NAD(P)H-dependent oxidoreductase, partial [Phaeodactylibacter sp.]|nr:NAD(P)H-dependent oxidoreductase [Phaeodactylibacter sp.]